MDLGSFPEIHPGALPAPSGTGLDTTSAAVTTRRLAEGAGRGPEAAAADISAPSAMDERWKVLGRPRSVLPRSDRADSEVQNARGPPTAVDQRHGWWKLVAEACLERDDPLGL